MTVDTAGKVEVTEIAASNNGARIQFTGASDIISYSVYYGLTSTTVTTLATNNASSPYQLSGLLNGIEYFVRLDGLTARGTTSSSKVFKVKPVAAFTVTSAIPGDQKATVVFPTVSGANAYTLVYGTTSGSYPTRVVNVSSPYQVTGLTNGQAYYFRVIASNDDYGLSTSTNEVTTTPVVGFNITSAVGTGSQLVVNWGAFAGATNYQVKFGTSSGAYTTFSTVTGTTETITGLDLTQPYYLMITADGTTNALSEYITLPQVGSLASTPTLLTSVITWNATTGPGTIVYDVYRSTTSGGALTSLATNLSALTYTDSSGSMGTKYYYKVVAKNNLGASTESVEATGTAPAAPTGLTATGGQSNVALSWTAATGPGTKYYDIYRATYSGTCGAYTKLNSGTVTTTTYNDISPSVIDGTTYCYKVVAINYGGSVSVDSSVVQATALGAFSISSIALNGGNTIRLSWGGSVGAVTYNVKYRTTPSGAYTTTLSGVTSPLDIGSLTAGTTYYFRVEAQATNSIADSNNSLSGIPISAFTITSIAPLTESLRVTYPAVTGATSYNVKYGTTSSYGTTSTGVTSPYAISGLTGGTTYHVQVSAVNATGSVDATAEVTGVPYTALGSSGILHYNDGNYSVSSGTYVDVNAGSNSLARLIAADQTDDTLAKFQSGGLTGTRNISHTAGYLVYLTSLINTTTLDPTWTPKYSSLLGYWPLDNDCSSNVLNQYDVISGVVGGDGIYYNNTTATAACTTDMVDTSVTFTTSRQVFWLDNPAGVIMPSTLTEATISAWIKPSNLAGGGTSRVFEIVNDNVSGVLSVLARSTANKLSFEYRTSSGVRPRVVTRSTFTVNRPMHIVLTISNNLGIFYVNGIEEARVTDVDVVKTLQEMNVNDTGTFIIGNSYSGTQSFAGKIGELAVFGQALTAADVENIYRRQSVKFSGTYVSRIMDSWNTVSNWANISFRSNGPYGKELVNVPEPAAEYFNSAAHREDWHDRMVGLWHLNESTGPTYADASGNNLHATANGDFSLNCNASGVNYGKACSGAMGVFRSSVKGNGTIGDYISLPVSTILQDVQEKDSTYSLWYRVTEYPTNASSALAYGALLMKGTAAAPFGLAINSTGYLVFLVTDSSGTVTTYTSPSPLEKSVWYHVFLTFDHTNHTFSLSTNGSSVFSNVDLGAGFNTYEYGTAQWGIGALNGSTYPFNGMIDEVAIWDNRAINNNYSSVMYMRGTMNNKFQVRTCTAVDCSDRAADPTGGWMGGNGSYVSYFPWEDQSLGTSQNVDFLTQPSLATWLANENKRYVQYKATLNSYDELGLVGKPDIMSVTLGNPHYISSSPYVTSTAAIEYITLSGFSESATCAGGVKYQLSADGSAWYYYSSGWVSATTGDANTASAASVVNTNISSFPAAVSASTSSNNNLYIRAYLGSSGSSSCEVDSVTVTGGKI